MASQSTTKDKQRLLVKVAKALRPASASVVVVASAKMARDPVSQPTVRPARVMSKRLALRVVPRGLAVVRRRRSHTLRSRTASQARLATSAMHLL